MCQKTITLYFINTLNLIPLICQPIITSGLAQINSILLLNWPQQIFNTYENLYIQIPPIKEPNKMLLATIIAQFVKI